MTPSRPMSLSLSFKKAQPRGSLENTKTGTFGPRVIAILPASDHFVETTKLGGLSKIGALLRSRHSNPSSVGSGRPAPVVKVANGQPVDDCKIVTAASAASSADERNAQRRRAPSRKPDSSSHAPINTNAKNHPGIVQ